MRKLLLGIIIIAILVFGGWFIFTLFFSTSYSFTINSDENVQISIATARNEAFQVIGTGSAEYTTKQTDLIYVRATKDGSITMQSVFPVDADGKIIELVMYGTKKPGLLLENPVTSPLLENSVVYGVYELTHSMFSVALEGATPPEFSYVSVPYVDSVVWLNSDNYHYNVFGGGVGSVINDSNEGELFLLNHLAWGEEISVEVSKTESKPFVLLSSTSLYISTNFGKSLKQIADIESCDSFFLDTDSKYIYYGKNLAPSEGASEGGDAESSSDNTFGANLTLYDYAGNTVINTTLSGVNTVTDTASFGSSDTLVATNKGLLHLDKTGEILNTYTFPFDLDNVVVYKDGVYLFSSENMWLLNLSSGSYSSVYNFDSSPYVSGSVQFTKTDGEILFTTLNSSVNYGALYKLSLK